MYKPFSEHTKVIGQFELTFTETPEINTRTTKQLAIRELRIEDPNFNWVCAIESCFGSIANKETRKSYIDHSSGWSAPRLSTFEVDMFSRNEWKKLLEASEIAWKAWDEKVW